MYFGSNVVTHGLPLRYTPTVLCRSFAVIPLKTTPASLLLTVLKPPLIAAGVPVWKITMVPSVQPLRTSFASLLLRRYARHLPNGRSYVPLGWTMWRMSDGLGAWFRRKLRFVR